MAGVNKAIIVGRLGRDPEIRYSPQGMAIVKLAVATSETWTDKATGQRQEKTEWHRITVFGKQGENCERFLSKGREVYVEGRLQTSSYEKEGQTHYSTEIIANTVQFLGGRQDTGGYQGQGSGGYQSQSGQPPQGGGFQPNQSDGGFQPDPTPPPSNAAPGMTGNQPPEDDIPF